MGLFDDILKGLPANAVLREQITQLNAQKAAAETENAILKDDLRQAKAEIAKLKKQVEEFSHKDDLEEFELELLQLISKASDNAYFEVIASEQRNVSRERLRYHLTNLEDAGYIEFGIVHQSYGELYGPTQKGRGVLIKRGLL